MRRLLSGVFIAVAVAHLSAQSAASQRPAGATGSVGQAARAGAPAFDVTEKGVVELQEAMTRSIVTSRQLVDAFLARIAAYDQRGPRINAFVTLNPRARETADALDRERTATGPRGPLHGIPVLVKDNYNTTDMPTTGSSLGLAGFTPATDAHLVRRLRDAGAVILGKTNLHELAAGIISVGSVGGQTRNPYDPARNAGGSSGGTGAAVAASFAAFGMGSDTCGSIRIPASHANLVGLRGTSGLSSRSGIIPLSHTQDIGGPLARTATDLAIALDATSGGDPNDPATAAGDGHRPKSFVAALDAGALQGARIGVLTTDVTAGDGADAEVTETVRRALDDMKKAGAELVDVSLPQLGALLSASGVIPFEFKFDLMDYLAREPSAPVKSLGEILDRGLYHAALEPTFRLRNATESRESEAYQRARAAREVLAQMLTVTLTAERLDAIAYPTMTRRPSLLGEPQTGGTCRASAHSGLPSITMPAGFTVNGFPVGLELLGLPWSDARLVSLAFAFEKAAPRRRVPPATPPLVNGQSPAPVVFRVQPEAASVIPPAAPGAGRIIASFEFDRVMGTLRFDVNVAGIAASDVLAMTLHRGAAGETGPVLHRLLVPGTLPVAGILQLTPRDRIELSEGRLYLQVYTRTHPLGAARAQLRP